jgi:hypothetical protein
MRTLIIVLIISFDLFAQNSCELISYSTLPPSPYDNVCLRFDGKGDFLRTRNIGTLEFRKSNTESFSIQGRIKISKPFVAQRILGKFYGTGWMLGYHTSQWGYISIYFGEAGWKHIYYLGGDSDWHTYKISYNRQSQSLKTFVDGVLTNEYTNFSYGNLQNNGAFSVGNVGFLPLSGNQSVNLYTNWLKGSVDYVRIDVNQIPVINCNFNEGVGQVARDSASYFLVDRTYPSEPDCGSSHLMLGFNPSQDTCDPEWVIEEPVQATKFRSLGSGLKYWHSGLDGEYYPEHFSLGLTVWDGYLINGGKFNRAGEIIANHVAKWDGNSWSALGGGLNHEVVYLAVYQNELYVTGYFDTAYGVGETKYIAKWDGNSWSAVDGGLSALGTVMIVYNGDLIVGGYFQSAGYNPASRIARWNGKTWQTLNQGVTGPVWALCEYNSELYAGGNFQSAGLGICNGIAKWNGSDWQPVGSGVSGGDNLVFVLKVYNGELYAGGSFLSMDGIQCYNISRYDGVTWHPVGSGVMGSECMLSKAQVIDMEVYEKELYIIGQFTMVDGIPANKIAKYNGTAWCPVEYGIDLRPEDLEIYQGDLIVNGDFFSISGNEFSNIAKYNPSFNYSGGNNHQTIIPDYRLYQNYPNPFNPYTEIKFDINKSGNVILKVYNLLGEEISTPVEEYKDAGSYSVRFNASDLSSGVYFYKIITDGFVESKKMLLIK